MNDEQTKKTRPQGLRVIEKINLWLTWIAWKLALNRSPCKKDPSLADLAYEAVRGWRG